MSEPIEQKQHRISQVYLKQFGYKKDGRWWVSVYQVSKKTTDNILIEQFTAETNIFDLPFNDIEIKRHFENTSNIIENGYRTVISNLHNQKRLTPKNKDLLCHFVPNLICRTEPFRSFIDSSIRTSDTRDNFLNEITLLTGDNKEIKELLSILKIDFQLNVAICPLMDHMVKVLRKFQQVVIKDCENKGWLTTDNPVFMDRQDHNEWIIPIEAEIYFPLSKDFCLYMFHDKSEQNENKLRQLKIDRVNEVDFSTFESMTKKILKNLNEFMIMPVELENSDVTRSGMKYENNKRT
jgi:hypothetical protein